MPRKRIFRLELQLLLLAAAILPTGLLVATFRVHAQRPTIPQNSLAATSPVSATTVPESFFGMHVHQADKQWPSVTFSGWRLWDADVGWPQLEPKKGEWHFDRLDGYVELAEQHHARILLVLGLSPQWASARPTEHSTYKPGNAAEPGSIEDWRNYVGTVAVRYTGRIHEYEIWNEPNITDFYSGTVDQLVELTRVASQVIKAVDPTAVVVSPAVTKQWGIPWFQKFLRAGGASYVDVIGYHYYVFPDGPEAMVPLLNQVQQTVQAAGINKPIWNTEAGWGVGKGNRADSMITTLAPAYVARAYILNWFGGVQRFYWYAWDNHWWVTLEMTDGKGRPNAAADAYARIRTWMLGKRLTSCQTQDSGNWVCVMSANGRNEWLVWNPDSTGMFRFSGARTATDLEGNARTVNGQVETGPSPLLIQ